MTLDKILQDYRDYPMMPDSDKKLFELRAAVRNEILALVKAAVPNAKYPEMPRDVEYADEWNECRKETLANLERL